MPGEPAQKRQDPAKRLSALARAARVAILWERAWPRALLALEIILVFLLLAALGLWSFAPVAARQAGVFLAGFAALAALGSILFLKRPGPAAGLGRLDRDSGLAHQPASAQFDANVLPSPEADALWALHRRALAAQAASVKLKAPAPKLAAIDRNGLRFLAPLALFAAAMLAGPELVGRLKSPFDWRGLPSAEIAKRIDAWIDPPHYTGQPPILLKQLATLGAKAEASTPEGSVLVLRAPEPFEAKASGGLIDPPAGAGANAGERRWLLKGDGALALTANGSDFSSLAVKVIPATPPSITFDGEPVGNSSGSLTLAYAIDDKYGAQSAEAEITLAEPAQGPALADAPKPQLTLPSSENGLGKAKTTADLSDHPWAGAKVRIVLKATNLAGAEGRSEAKVITLPQRLFHDPLAKALVEQRRDLILDPLGKRAAVDRVLEALAIEPESFGEHDGAYLGLRQVQKRLGEDADLPRLKDAADWLWAIALRLEDGSSSQAQRNLRAAEKDLRDALKRGAGDQEIRPLTQKLREAAERMMRELAKQAPDAQEDANLDSQDLESMLDKLEDQARNGARDEAQAMLDQLQDMFENMRVARKGENQQAQAMRKQLSELDKLMRDQQALRDDTFRSQQRERAAPGQDGQDDAQSLQERQQALEKRLEELQKQLSELGADAEKGFDDAGKAMGEAEGDLGQGQTPTPGKGQGQAPGQGQTPGHGGKGPAVEAQGRALQALREGAQGLQNQMNAQNGQGQGQGGRVGMNKQGGGKGGRDPLGKDNDPLGKSGQAGGALGDTEGATQRARRVMEELQRRLADPNRPGDEKDYFERLLKRF